MDLNKDMSRIPDFYDLDVEERISILLKKLGFEDDMDLTSSIKSGLDLDNANNMIENVVGLYGLPIGIATNFLINERDVLVPMVIEEASVVAGASLAAKLARMGGGFQAETTSNEMIGQMQVLDLENIENAKSILMSNKDVVLDSVKDLDPMLNSVGGGIRDLEVRLVQESTIGPFLIIHVIYDTCDAMGANAVNTAVEYMKPVVEDLIGGRVHLRILSNLADRRIARACVSIPTNVLSFGTYDGEKVRDGIVEASIFAEVDSYRASTHNKGIMNGVDAVVMATGNDWRAIEAGAHAYASRHGSYTSLSKWSVGVEGNLVGEIEMPMAVGIIGGATRVHPGAQAALKILGVASSKELSEVIVSVGLAQNLASLRALSTEGIQKGHMGLHARQVAIAAGAEGDQINVVADQMVTDKKVNVKYAERLLS